MDIQNPSPRRIRHAVEIDADADHAFMRGPMFEPENRLIGRKRQRLERAFLPGKRLVDDAPRRRMHPRIGYPIEPLAQLIVQILEIAEGAAEEEVLADVAERALDLALGFGPIG
jgi:hypothetical protein